MFSNPLSLILLGLLNRLFLSPISTLFICYPASQKYADMYCFRFMTPIIKHYPAIVGIFFQGGRLGLVTTISSVESDFTNPDFFSKFGKYKNFISRVVGTKDINCSGILPTMMKRAALIKESELVNRSSLVSKVVSASESIVRENSNLDALSPVIILGGKGSVGKQVTTELITVGRSVYVVDKGDELPSELRNKPAILLDISRSGVINNYLSEFWNGLVVLNETYPEPPKRVREILQNKNIPLYHIAGVKAFALPKFPHAYAGGVPCCAINATNNFEALVTKLA